MALPWIQNQPLPDSPTVRGFNQIRQQADAIRLGNEEANDGRRPMDLIMAFAQRVAEGDNPAPAGGGFSQYEAERNEAEGGVFGREGAGLFGQRITENPQYRIPTASPSFNPGMPTGGYSLPATHSQQAAPESPLVVDAEMSPFVPPPAATIPSFVAPAAAEQTQPPTPWEMAEAEYEERVVEAIQHWENTGDRSALDNLMLGLKSFPNGMELRNRAQARIEGVESPTPPAAVVETGDRSRDAVISEFAELITLAAERNPFGNPEAVEAANAYRDQFQITDEEQARAIELANLKSMEVEPQNVADAASVVSTLANKPAAAATSAPPATATPPVAAPEQPAAKASFLPTGESETAIPSFVSLGDGDRSGVFNRPYSSAQELPKFRRARAAERTAEIAAEGKAMDDSQNRLNGLLSSGSDGITSRPRPKTEAEIVREILTNPDDRFWKTETGRWGLQNMKNFGKVLQSLQGFAGLSGDEKELSWLGREQLKHQLKLHEEAFKHNLTEATKARDEARLDAEMRANPAVIKLGDKEHNLGYNHGAITEMALEGKQGEIFAKHLQDFPSVISSMESSKRAVATLELLKHVKETGIDKLDRQGLINQLNSIGVDNSTILNLANSYKGGVRSENIADILDDTITDLSVFSRIFYTSLRQANSGFTGIGPSGEPLLTYRGKLLGLVDGMFNFFQKQVLGEADIEALNSHLNTARRVSGDLANKARQESELMGRRVYSVLKQPRQSPAVNAETAWQLYAPSGSAAYQQLSSGGGGGNTKLTGAGARGKKSFSEDDYIAAGRK